MRIVTTKQQLHDFLDGIDGAPPPRAIGIRLAAWLVWLAAIAAVTVCGVFQ